MRQFLPKSEINQEGNAPTKDRPFSRTEEDFMLGVFEGSQINNHQDKISWMIHLFGFQEITSYEDIPQPVRDELSEILKRFQGNFAPLGTTYSANSSIYRYGRLREQLENYAKKGTLSSDGVTMSTPQFKVKWNTSKNQLDECLRKMQSSRNSSFLTLVSVVKAMSSRQYGTQDPFEGFKKSTYGQYCLQTLGELDFHELWLFSDNFRGREEMAGADIAEKILESFSQKGKEFKIFFAFRAMAKLKNLPNSFIRVATIPNSVEQALTEDQSKGVFLAFVALLADTKSGAIQSTHSPAVKDGHVVVKFKSSDSKVLRGEVLTFYRLLDSRQQSQLDALADLFLGNSLGFQAVSNNPIFTQFFQTLWQDEKLRDGITNLVKKSH